MLRWSPEEFLNGAEKRVTAQETCTKDSSFKQILGPPSAGAKPKRSRKDLGKTRKAILFVEYDKYNAE